MGQASPLSVGFSSPLGRPFWSSRSSTPTLTVVWRSSRGSRLELRQLAEREDERGDRPRQKHEGNRSNPAGSELHLPG